MTPAQIPAGRPVRARRLASYGIDVLLFAVPWLLLSLLAVAPPGGGPWLGGIVVVGALAFAWTAALIVAQVALFLRRGRTLGMGVTGLVAVSGIRWLALLLDPALAVVTGAVAAPVLFALGASTALGDSAYPLMLAVPVIALAGNLCFLLGRESRTLTDRVAGLRVEHRPRA